MSEQAQDDSLPVEADATTQPTFLRLSLNPPEKH